MVWAIRTLSKMVLPDYGLGYPYPFFKMVLPDYGLGYTYPF